MILFLILAYSDLIALIKAKYLVYPSSRISPLTRSTDNIPWDILQRNILNVYMIMALMGTYVN